MEKLENNFKGGPKDNFLMFFIIAMKTKGKIFDLQLRSEKRLETGSQS
jgi:hypothetical protein